MFWNVASARDEISLRKWSGGSAHLRTFRGALVAKTALCWQQCFFFTHVSLHKRGEQTCSMEESFAENQKHQRAAKAVCGVNTNTVKNASFTLNDVQ